MSTIAEILVELRRELFKIAIIIIVVSSVFFTFFANPLIKKVVFDFFPAEEVLKNKQRILEISKELRDISNDLMNYSKGMNVNVFESIRKLVRITTELSCSPILISPLEALILNLKISFAVGILSSIPYIALVSYRGLKRTEEFKDLNLSKTTAFKYLIISVILFAAGVLYGYNMMKIFIEFLYSTAVSQGVIPLYSLSEFVSFVLLMLFLFGFVFELPLITFFLVKNGIVKYETLKYYRRHIYVAFFVIGAITTPPDVFTQLMVAVPMVLFFEISLLFIKVFVSPAQS